LGGERMISSLEIYIAHISWGEGGKNRPVLIFFVDDEYLLIYPITSQYEHKSEAIKAKYFEIFDLKEAGLSKTSYVDTGNMLQIKKSTLTNKIPLGKLSENDKLRFLSFLKGKE
jgi:hypothetical protein